MKFVEKIIIVCYNITRNWLRNESTDEKQKNKF